MMTNWNLLATNHSDILTQKTSHTSIFQSSLLLSTYTCPHSAALLYLLLDLSSLKGTGLFSASGIIKAKCGASRDMGAKIMLWDIMYSTKLLDGLDERASGTGLGNTGQYVILEFEYLGSSVSSCRIW